MPDSKLDIQERHEGDVTVLSLTGQITLDDGDLLFRKRVLLLAFETFEDDASAIKSFGWRG